MMRVVVQGSESSLTDEALVMLRKGNLLHFFL